MGGIGNETPSGFLRRLQAAGQAVEFAGDLGDLIGAAYLGAVAVRPLTHRADGLQQAADAAGEHPREQKADADGKHRRHNGNGH